MYLGLEATVSGVLGSAGRRRAGVRGRVDDGDAGLANGQGDADVASEGIAGSRLDEAEEMPLDPFAGEVVRDDERERVVGQVTRGRISEPRRVCRFVECLLKPARDVVPQAFGSRLGGVFHPSEAPLGSVARRASIAASPPRFQPVHSAAQAATKHLFCREFLPSTQISTGVENSAPGASEWQRHVDSCSTFAILEPRRACG